MDHNGESFPATPRESSAAVKNADHDAAARLTQLFGDRLLRLSRCCLRGAPVAVADEHDVAQVVLVAAVKAQERGRLPSIDAPDDLWRVLRTITRRTVRRWRKREQRRRGVYVAAGRSATRRTTAPADDRLIHREQEESLLGRLGNETLRAIACWKRDGATNAEIAARLGVHTRTVERDLRDIRERRIRARAKENE